MNDFDFSIFESESSGLKKKFISFLIRFFFFSHFSLPGREMRETESRLIKSPHNNIKKKKKIKSNLFWWTPFSLLPDFLPATRRRNNNKLMKKKERKKRKIYKSWDTIHKHKNLFVLRHYICGCLASFFVSSIPLPPPP